MFRGTKASLRTKGRTKTRAQMSLDTSHGCPSTREHPAHHGRESRMSRMRTPCTGQKGSQDSEPHSTGRESRKARHRRDQRAARTRVHGGLGARRASRKSKTDTRESTQGSRATLQKRGRAWTRAWTRADAHQGRPRPAPRPQGGLPTYYPRGASAQGPPRGFLGREQHCKFGGMPRILARPA